ncbi:MAG: hypothetical protein JXR26_09840 [Balneolaceae bacterium]|nr:hypothetical protein [Balneolaceae bacterium]
MLKTIILAIFFILLVRYISRLFGPAGKKKNSNFRFFYQTFKNVRQQQKQQEQRQRQNPSKNGTVKKGNLDNIEEAEFEDVTEDDSDKK